MKQFDYSLDFKVSTSTAPELYRVGKENESAVGWNRTICLSGDLDSEIARESTAKFTPCFKSISIAEILLSRHLAASSCRWELHSIASFTPTTKAAENTSKTLKAQVSVAEQSAARKDILPATSRSVKARIAAIFPEKWMLAKINEKYLSF